MRSALVSVDCPAVVTIKLSSRDRLSVDMRRIGLRFWILGGKHQTKLHSFGKRTVKSTKNIDLMQETETTKKAVGETPTAFRFYPHHYRTDTLLYPTLLFNLPFVKRVSIRIDHQTTAVGPQYTKTNRNRLGFVLMPNQK